MSTRARFAAAVAGLFLTAGFVASGCSEGDEAGTAGGSDAADNAAPVPKPADGAQDDQGRQAGQPGGAVPQQPQQPSLARAIIRTGFLTLESGDVSKSRDRVSAITTSFSGQIANEETGTDEEGGVDRANLVLRIPTASYDRAMKDLRSEDVGKVKQIRQESSDVTEQVVDVNSRVATQRAGLARMRALLSRANTIGEVVSVENELTRREADLESLLAKQKALAAQTELATITVTLVRPGEAPPPPPEDRSGFIGGLSAGWDAFSAMVKALATAAGALLPFAAAAVLVGVPVLLLYRRQRHTAAPARTTTAPPD